MALGYIFLSEYFCGYCLCVWLSVCKRISLDGNYLLVIFILKVGIKVRITVMKNKVNFTLLHGND